MEVPTESLRQAGAQDEGLLFALFAQDKAAEFAASGLQEAQFGPLIEMQYRGRQMTYAAQYPDAEDSILLAENGTPVGRLLVDRKPHCWRVVDIGVLAAQRGQGLGTRALRECQGHCKAAGTRLELQVGAQNPARGLYERLGFHAVREDAVAVEMVWDPAR